MSKLHVVPLNDLRCQQQKRVSRDPGPGGSGDLPLITVHSQFIVHLSAIAISLRATPPPVLLRAMGTTLVAGSTSKGGSFGGGNVPYDCTQEKGEPLLKADSGPEDIPPDLYRCLNGTERGLINGQANNEGTMNERTTRRGGGEGKGVEWRLVIARSFETKTRPDEKFFFSLLGYWM